MDANSMSPAELRALADNKEKDEVDRPVKTGTLKFDLYDFDDFDLDWYYTFDPECMYFTKEEVDQCVKELPSKFKIVLSKGTKFVCYLENDRDSWYDTSNYGVERMSNKWAEKHLENIQVFNSDKP
jgi:hypothetical protein